MSRKIRRTFRYVRSPAKGVCALQNSGQSSLLQCAPPTLVPASPLPIAAAHHPGNLAAFNAPLFTPPTKSISTNADSSEGNMRPSQVSTEDRLAERVASIERTRQALLDAALHLDNVRLDLERRSRKVQSVLVTRPGLHLGIWEAPSRTPIDFRVSIRLHFRATEIALLWDLSHPVAYRRQGKPPQAPPQNRRQTQQSRNASLGSEMPSSPRGLSHQHPPQATQNWR